ncbi:PTS glucose transporter subunit IIA [Lactobacillus sp. XV13L]|nr:PTS glucose transporter subunit IIA [Lactobacillus sp. XV13L]
MFGFRKKKKRQFSVFAPINGELTNLKDVKDPVFSQKMMGDGFAIMPAAEADVVCAPVAGRIASLPNTKHAVGIVTDDSDEILVHIGIDTVNLNGKGFTALVQQNDYVKQGQELIKLDRDAFTAENADLTTMVVFTKLSTDNQNWQMLKKYGDHVDIHDVLVKQKST